MFILVKDTELLKYQEILEKVENKVIIKSEPMLLEEEVKKD